MKKLDDIVSISDLKQYLESLVSISFNEDDKQFIAGVNYLIGIRLTLKRSTLEANNDYISKNVVSEVKPKIYNTVRKNFDSEGKSTLSITSGKQFNYFEKEAYKNKGGYVQHLIGNLTKTSATDALNEFSQLIDKSLIGLTIEFLFFNVNHKLLIYLAQSFLVNHESTIKYSETINGFDPTLYSTTNKGTGRLVAMYVLAIIFQVLVLYEILKLLFAFTHYIIDLASGNKLYVAASDVTSTIILAFTITSIVYWYILLFESKYFSILN